MKAAASVIFVFASWLALATAIFGSCTDAQLYGKSEEDPNADRLGLKGRVCTDDPREAGFPVRVIFVVDVAMGSLFSTFDSEQLRLKAIKETLSLHEGNDAFSFAVIGFGSRARLLAPEEGYFTRNPGDLDNAVSTLGLPQGCAAGVCRDYVGALSLAKSMIEGDLAGMDAGRRSRTQYAVVLMAAGLPSPLACEHDCCDPSNEECDYSTCVESTACTRTVLNREVLKIRDEVESKGASSFSLHVLFLAAPQEVDDAGPANPLDETENILKEIAFSGAGRFERFNTPDAITLDRIGLLKLSALFEAKGLLVTNASVLPSLGEPAIDSDGDGLADDVETELGTDPMVRDSDGDGIGDLIETLISFNPLKRETAPAACSSLKGPRYGDVDGDRLNDCEELLLGTDPSLPDSDGDSIPDWMEVALGTDYLHVDTLDDADGDGAYNGDELLQHTDPRSSDAASHLESAYRYDVTDEGLVKEPAIASPQRITGVAVLSAGADTSGGLGSLRYTPGPPPMLSWKDAMDEAAGVAVDVSVPRKYELPSSSVEEAKLERSISVEVDPALLPPTPAEETLLVELSERHCLSFTLRNIRLVETKAAAGEEGGMNDVFVYFAESPAGRLTLPGLFRVAHIPVVYHKGKGRDPDEPLVEVGDDEFVAIGY